LRHSFLSSSMVCSISFLRSSSCSLCDNTASLWWYLPLTRLASWRMESASSTRCSSSCSRSCTASLLTLTLATSCLSPPLLVDYCLVQAGLSGCLLSFPEYRVLPPMKSRSLISEPRSLFIQDLLHLLAGLMHPLVHKPHTVTRCCTPAVTGSGLHNPTSRDGTKSRFGCGSSCDFGSIFDCSSVSCFTPAACQ
jgi:hypothetical protein